MQFSELHKGVLVSGTYKNIQFSGIVTYTWTDSAAKGTKVATIRLIPRCPGEGLPIIDSKRPAPYDRAITLYYSDLWNQKAILDQEYQVHIGE